MHYRIYLSLFILSYGSLQAQLSEVVVSNLTEIPTTQASVGSTSADGFNNLASSFTTGSESYFIESVRLSIGSLVNSPTGEFSVFLMSDVGDDPGSVLFQFSGETAPFSGEFVYTAPANQILLPNTQYWIATVDINETTSFARYTVLRTNSDAETSAFGWTIGDDSRLTFTDQVTGPWSNVQLPVHQFSVTATVVPEPAAYAAFIGLVALLGVLRRRLRRK